MPTSAPNTSLYIKNINTKVRKAELRQQLYSLFSTYGKVIDVIATRVNGMRGQAFVVFRDLQSATTALRALEGAMFYDKTLSIDYAQKKSHATLIQEKGPAALYDPTLFASSRASGSGTAAGAEKDGAPLPGKVTYSSAQAEARGREKKRARDEARERGEAVAEEEDEEGGDGKRAKRSHPADEEDAMEMEDDSDNDDAPGPPAPGANGDTGPAPSATLYCSDLPTEVTDDMLGVLFQQYSGFQTVTHRPARGGKASYAVVRYDSVQAASTARDALQGFLLKPGAKLEVEFATAAQAQS